MIEQNLPKLDSTTRQSRRGLATLKRLRELRIGAGETMFGADVRGIWLGASTPENAPFSVDMAGNISGLSFSGINITGSTISGSTITGGTIQTSNTNTRVELSGSLNALSVYQAYEFAPGEFAPVERLRINENGISFARPDGLGSGSIYGFGTEQLAFDVGNTYILNATQFYPIPTNTCDLGDSSFEWRDIYLINSPTVSSDIRFKENIKPLKYGLDEVEKMNPVSFTRKDSDTIHLGFSAQELKEILPEIVKGEDQLSIRPEEIIPVLVNAIKELSDEINYLKNNIV